MKEKKLDWKQIGQFVAMLVRFYSTIVETFRIHAVGPEIINWLDGGIGKDVLLQKLEEIATEYRALTVPKEISVNTQNILHINRIRPFNPVPRLGRGWEIEEEDPRSLPITELDLTKVRFMNMLRGEGLISGEENQRRLKEAGYICLDAKIALTICLKKEYVQMLWNKLGRNQQFKSIRFDGSVLRGPDNHRYVVHLGFYPDGRMSWGVSSLGRQVNVECLSAIITSSQD